MTRADLHVHTTASDGQTSPEAVVVLALQHNLDTIAITDHDTTDGVELACDSRLTIIPGIELGARDGSHKIDILGYFIDIHHPNLQRRLAEFQHARFDRGRKIVNRLAAHDTMIDWVRVTALAQGNVVGRPHIAQVLIESGYVTSIGEAFDRYIGVDCPAYVPGIALFPEEAIQLIHDAGGVAVLAHPVFVKNFPALVERLVPAGLDGIELCYPEHSGAIKAQVRDLAQRYDLVMTGGSDFHGPGVKSMIGAALAPEGSVEALRERATTHPNPSPH
jgi:hypothetical protein